MKSAEEKMKINDLKNKYLAMFLSGIIALIMLLSAMYMAEEVHHECSGEECPVYVAPRYSGFREGTYGQLMGLR